MLQVELFEYTLCELTYEGCRLIVRRNPLRTQAMAQSRVDKLRCIEAFVEQRDVYLQEHLRAKVQVAMRSVQRKMTTLKVSPRLHLTGDVRSLILYVDQHALEESSRLDGCYVVLTDLTCEQGDAQLIHDRYRDLARIEQGFRATKTGHLELRSVYVRTKEHTCGQVFVVMLSYPIRWELKQAWQPFNITVEEGLDLLGNVGIIPITLSRKSTIEKVTTPGEQIQKLLQALQVKLPPVIPKSKVRVATKEKLQPR